jgi:copper chaperone CopZ
MTQLKFKTNIKCGGCIATVKPHLDQLEGIINWSVDTAHPEKILTVETQHLNPDTIIKSIIGAGYKAVHEK